MAVEHFVGFCDEPPTWLVIRLLAIAAPDDDGDALVAPPGYYPDRWTSHPARRTVEASAARVCANALRAIDQPWTVSRSELHEGPPCGGPSVSGAREAGSNRHLSHGQWVALPVELLPGRAVNEADRSVFSRKRLQDSSTAFQARERSRLGECDYARLTTPRLTASARPRRWRLQLTSSDHGLQIPTTGRPVSAVREMPCRCGIEDRWMNPARSRPANQRSLRIAGDAESDVGDAADRSATTAHCAASVVEPRALKRSRR